MSILHIRRLILLAIVALPAVAGAQRGGVRPGGFPGRPGGREPGLAVPPIVNAVNLLILHRRDLALTDSQFARIIALKRSVDSTNAPLMRRLDSLQRENRPSKDPTASFNDDERRRDALAELRETIKEIRANIQPVRDRAFDLLTGEQPRKAKEIEDEAWRVAEAAAAPRGARPPG